MGLELVGEVPWKIWKRYLERPWGLRKNAEYPDNATAIMEGF